MTSEGSEEPTATRKSSTDASGERNDSRDSDGAEEPSPAREPPPDETDIEREAGPDNEDDIPLQIVGHDDRERPGAADDTQGEGGTVLEFTEPDDARSRAAAGDESDTDAGTGDEDDEVEPVELLVQLAENGDIDPWDIDVVRVTDKFLEALDDADLRTSGRALFYASVLLRMKSDELFATDEPEEDELPPWEAPFADEGGMGGGASDPAGDAPGAGFDPVDSLEAEMDRRLERKHVRGKPETLDELVRELRSAERGTWWKESRSYDTSDSPHGYDRGVQELSYHSGDDFRVDDEPTSDDVTHTTHEEDIETVIDDVEAELAARYERGRGEVLYAEIAETGGSRVMTYLALLFLAHRGRLTLDQDELFGDLWIQDATTVPANDAVAE
ncbi:segregation and condensation protein A [Natrialba asiatica]|uniref:Chromosome segregation and condensation protein ScpA n=1 Tax=Natrialba asiatica (strain ATCC 700177 / DSM 12278 / JCM 9576 / FERM P-10747 / NBRC 102637 / 172P1) TaxID=29540 RepID=M0AKE4_NATA1|nr:ScpA family protein [Natrialba asiatica]ELY99170.1 chromosome segregation and condensation protein ScpA [Natrialba asiatica DSM 12278]